MPEELKTLEENYRSAGEAFANDPSEENHAKYEEAKLQFVDARAAERKAAEQDPDNPRGTALVVITNEDGVSE